MIKRWDNILLILLVFFPYSILSASVTISKVTFKSNFSINQEYLSSICGLVVGSEFSNTAVQNATRIISEELLKEGHYFIQVDNPEIIPISYNSVEIIFNINTYLTEKITEFRFSGLRNMSSAKLSQLLFLPHHLEIPLSDIGIWQKKIIDIFNDHGYLFASVELDSLISRTDGLTAVLKIDEGKHLQPASFIYKGNKITKGKTLLSLSGLQNTAVITPSVLAQAEVNIRKKPYIKNCEITPLDDRTLLFQIEEQKMTYLEGVVGTSKNDATNRLQYNGYAKIDFLNLWGTDRNIKVYWRSQPKKLNELSFGYHESGWTKYPFAGDVTLYRIAKDTTWIKMQTQLDIYYYQMYNKYGISLSRESSQLRSLDSSLVSVIESWNTYKTGLIWDYTKTDNFQNPTHGIESNLKYYWIIRSDAQIENASELDFANYLSISKHSVFAIALHLKNNSNKQMKVYDQYYMGGYNSLRGFGEDYFHSRRLGWLSGELRYLLSSDSRTYVFIDQGYIEQNRNKLKTDIFGFGCGIKIKTKLGIMSVEYALNYIDKRVSPLSQGLIHLGINTQF